MAKRDSVYRPNDAESAVVIGASVYDVPLLPYERQLIATIGITEEEYRAFTAEVKRRGAVRPAAYDHIPDVQAGATGTAILINLAISLVLTGVSYLLTPKPKMPAAQKQGGIIDLGSVTGANRFTPSRGFETLAELADYASPIPLIFGLYKDDIGGMLITPKLIWSRMFSHGTMQRAKLMFVVGEQGVGSAGIQPPDLEGIFLGNNALDAVFNDLFAFYWHADSSEQFRIRGTDKKYGTRGKAHRGDPDVPNDNSDAFAFPLSDIDKEPSEIFCHAFTPANSTTFGVYGAIANGTHYRVNYQLISIPKVNDKKAMAIRTLERIKIVGDSGVKSGDNDKTLQEENIEPGDAGKDRLNEIREKGNHAGAGRNYSPRMGIVSYKGNAVPSGQHRKTYDNVEVGDRAEFVIRNTSISPNFYRRDGRGASVDDINSTVESFQIEADSAMQVGEHFEIGGCIWKVVSRSLAMFDPLEGPERNQNITLECVDTLLSKSKKIGVVSESLVVNPSTQFIGDSAVGETSKGVGETFYPLTQVEIATVKNNRPSVATEIGLKSTVFQRLNGLCNFQSLPTPTELKDAEEDEIQMNSGSISASILRSSIFRIFMRDVNSDITDFIALPQFFVVRGQTPVAQYNYIRFTSKEPRQLEYKFVPFSGSEFAKLPDNTTPEFIVLSQSISTDQNEKGAGNFFEFSETIPSIGKVKVQVTGQRIFGKTTFRSNKEFTRGGRTVSGEETLSYPTAAAFVTATPEPEVGTIAEIGSQLKKEGNISDPGITTGKIAAFLYKVAGSADSHEANVGSSATFKSVEYIGGSHASWLHLKWTLGKTNAPDYSSESTAWKFISVEVIGSGGGFSDGQKIEVKRGSEATNVVTGQADYSTDPNSENYNPFAANHPDGTLRFSGMRLKVNGVTKNVTLGDRLQAWMYEVGFGAVDRPPNESKTITKTFTQGDKSIRVKLTSSVILFPGVESAGTVVGNEFGWVAPIVTEIVQNDLTSKTWNVGDTFSSRRAVSADNPFKTGYSHVGATYKITDVSYESTEPATFEAELFFAEQTQISDISAYRGFVEKSNSTSPEHEIVYINEAQVNDDKANMLGLTIAGLSLKASRSFTALDQLRCWLGSGLPVERLHPVPKKAYGDSSTVGPSNLFTDLIYFLLTDQRAGAGGLLGIDGENHYLVDKQDLINTSEFLEHQKLFFNGPIVERTNLRQFISELAPYFLCNFIISDGKFSLKPAVPVTKGGEIDTGAVNVKQIFTGGNILEDSYKLEYLGAEERRAFKAVVRYRQERKNRLPEEQVVIVKGTDTTDDFASPGTDLLPEEQFDLTQFCTSKDHAVKVAKYFLALRAYVTHTISFSTTAEGLSIGAGSYIKVITEASPYNAANTGTVNSSGVVTSVADMPDGLYLVTFFKVGSDDIDTKQMQVSNGKVESSTFHNIVFTVEDTTVSENIYIVEQLTFSQDGIVDIVASEHPCNPDGTSKVAAFITSTSGFSIQS
tara:strand:+ start:8299 stop:12750 length:4452 start_codon:yes stop_codon:yes gene_type:complete